VFIAYLYQRWIYSVDKKRVNEFGQTGEAKDENKWNSRLWWFVTVVAAYAAYRFDLAGKLSQIKF
jgi:hypothetical protein